MIKNINIRNQSNYTHPVRQAQTKRLKMEDQYSDLLTFRSGKSPVDPIGSYKYKVIKFDHLVQYCKFEWLGVGRVSIQIPNGRA